MPSPKCTKHFPETQNPRWKRAILQPPFCVMPSYFVDCLYWHPIKLACRILSIRTAVLQCKNNLQVPIYRATATTAINGIKKIEECWQLAANMHNCIVNKTIMIIWKQLLTCPSRHDPRLGSNVNIGRNWLLVSLTRLISFPYNRRTWSLRHIPNNFNFKNKYFNFKCHPRNFKDFN